MRLVAFGCSLTVGDGLANPQTESWPNIISNMLGCDTVVNNGSSGASNKEITWIIQNFNFQKDDIVIILWSHKDRYCIIHERKIQALGIWSTEVANTLFFEHLHYDYDMSVDMHTRINYISNMLDGYNLKQYHAYCDTTYKANFKWHITPMLTTNLKSIEMAFPKAQDNLHPSKEAHTAFATAVYNEIKGL